MSKILGYNDEKFRNRISVQHLVYWGQSDSSNLAFVDIHHFLIEIGLVMDCFDSGVL